MTAEQLVIWLGFAALCIGSTLCAACLLGGRYPFFWAMLPPILVVLSSGVARISTPRVAAVLFAAWGAGYLLVFVALLRAHRRESERESAARALAGAWEPGE